MTDGQRGGEIGNKGERDGREGREGREMGERGERWERWERGEKGERERRLADRQTDRQTDTFCYITSQAIKDSRHRQADLWEQIYTRYRGNITVTLCVAPLTQVSHLHPLHIKQTLPASPSPPFSHPHQSTPHPSLEHLRWFMGEVLQVLGLHQISTTTGPTEPGLTLNPLSHMSRHTCIYDPSSNKTLLAALS